MRGSRKYDKEFKLNAIKHYEINKKSLNEVSHNLGILIFLPKSVVSVQWDRQIEGGFTPG